VETLADGCREVLRSRALHKAGSAISKSSDVVSRNRKRGRVQPLGPRRACCEWVNTGIAVRPHVTADAAAARRRSRGISDRKRRSHDRARLEQSNTCQLPSAEYPVAPGEGQ